MYKIENKLFKITSPLKTYIKKKKQINRFWKQGGTNTLYK